MGELLWPDPPHPERLLVERRLGGAVCPLTLGSRCHETWPFSRFLSPLLGRSHWMSQCLPAAPHCHRGPVPKTPVSRYQVGDRYLRGDWGLNRSASPIVRIRRGEGRWEQSPVGLARAFPPSPVKSPRLVTSGNAATCNSIRRFFCLPSFA